MTNEQQKQYDAMRVKFDPDLIDNPAFDNLLRQYAIMVDESHILQRFIDENGVAYLHTPHRGDPMWKVYPQHLALGKMRTQMATMLRMLLKYSIEGEDIDPDEQLIK